MIVRPREYARAFLAALASGSSYDAAKSRLLTVLARHGQTHRLPQVVREIEKIEVAKQGGRIVEVEFARELDSQAVVTLTDAFAPTDRVLTRLNPALVAGTRITVNQELELDLSFAGKIRALFQP